MRHRVGWGGPDNVVADEVGARCLGKIVMQLAIYPGSSGSPVHMVAVTFSKDGRLVDSDSRLPFQRMSRVFVGRVLETRRTDEIDNLPAAVVRVRP